MLESRQFIPQAVNLQWQVLHVNDCPKKKLLGLSNFMIATQILPTLNESFRLHIFPKKNSIHKNSFPKILSRFHSKMSEKKWNGSLIHKLSQSWTNFDCLAWNSRPQNHNIIWSSEKKILVEFLKERVHVNEKVYMPCPFMGPKLF